MRAPLVAFLLVALNQRIAVVALSPVLTRIERGEHLSDTVAGLLTTLPLICFGLFAFATPHLVRRLGPQRTVVVAVAAIVVGIASRLGGATATLFGGTLLAGAGIGIANAVMPGIIRRDFAGRASTVTGLYTTMLFVSGALGAGLTVPLMGVAGVGWRSAVALWGIPAVAALVLSAWYARRPEPPPAADVPVGPAVRLREVMGEPLAWTVTAFMGLQSLEFYAISAWMPTILQGHHLSSGRAGWLLSFATLVGVLGALGTPGLYRRLGDGVVPVLVGVAMFVVGYGGLLVDPVPLVYLWMACLGLGSGISLSLGIHYIVVRSPADDHAGHLAAMALGFGFLLASAAPAGLGALHSLTGAWTVPLLALVALAAVQLAAGAGASRDRQVLAGRPVVAVTAPEAGGCHE